jgi:phage antirepressor YoqD-like protein
MLIPREALMDYKRKKINRMNIAIKYNVDIRTVNARLRNNGIQIWDRKIKRNFGDQLASLYINGMSRADIAKKYGISERNLTELLYVRGIELWDRKVKKKNKRINEKYFSWDEFKNHYFFQVNK